MGIFDFIRKARHGAVQRRDSGTAIPWGGLSGTRGVDRVDSAELAMRIAAAYRCIDILSKGIAQLPLEVKTDRGGYYSTDEGDPLNYLLSVRPNDRHTAFEMMRNTVIQMVTRGNAYLYPEFGEDGWERVVLLTPGSCSYDLLGNRYIVNDVFNGVAGVFVPDEIIHIRNLSLDGGYTGVSTIAYAAKVLAITSNADDDNIETFRSQGLLRGFVSGKSSQTMGFGAIQDSQLKDVADDVQRQLDSGRKIFSLPGEMAFNQISLSPADIELLATKQFNVLEICRFFGVPPDKVFAQQSTNYKASEMSQVAFLTDTLQPYLRQFEQEFQTKLIPRSLYGQYRIDFNIDSLMQTDLTTQAAYIEKTIATGTRTVNSWRRRYGQPPVEGGDEVMVSANLVPLNSAKLWGSEQQEGASVKKSGKQEKD